MFCLQWTLRKLKNNSRRLANNSNIQVVEWKPIRTKKTVTFDKGKLQRKPRMKNDRERHRKGKQADIETASV